MTQKRHQHPCPLYAVEWLRNGVFLAGGGGGSSKTGIPNQMDLCTFTRHGDIVVESSFNDISEPVMGIAANPAKKDQMACVVGKEVLLISAEGANRLVVKKRINIGEDGKCVLFNPAGTMMCVGGEEGRLMLCRSDGHVLKTMQCPYKEDGPNSAAFHPTQPLLAVSWRDGLVKVYNIGGSGGVVDVAQLHPPGNKCKTFRKCCFSSDGSALYTLQTGAKGGSHQAEVTCWNAASWTAQRTGLVGSLAATTMAYSADGRFLAVGSSSGAVCVLDASTLAVRMRRMPSDFIVTSLCFSPDVSSLLVGCADSATSVLDLSNIENDLQRFALLVLFMLAVIIIYAYFIALL